MACFHACLNEFPSEMPGFAFKGTDLICNHCVSNENFAITVKGEFGRLDFRRSLMSSLLSRTAAGNRAYEGFYFRFVGLSRSTYKLSGKHMQTKKISHPWGCCEFACGRIIRWGKKP